MGTSLKSGTPQSVLAQLARFFSFTRSRLAIATSSPLVISFIFSLTVSLADVEAKNVRQHQFWHEYLTSTHLAPLGLLVPHWDNGCHCCRVIILYPLIRYDAVGKSVYDDHARSARSTIHTCHAHSSPQNCASGSTRLSRTRGACPPVKTMSKR